MSRATVEEEARAQAIQITAQAEAGRMNADAMKQHLANWKALKEEGEVMTFAEYRTMFMQI
jgi:hypothetical protein